jgi:hypothetical protein
MLEKWIKKGESKFDIWGRKLFRQASILPMRIWGVGVLSLAFILVAARPTWDYTHEADNARLDAIANEVGSIGFMIQGMRARWFAADPPLINHAGTQMLYCQTSENGAALFSLDLDTGYRKQLYEEPATLIQAGPTTALAAYAWSPDDTRIVYTRADPGRSIYSYDDLVVAEAANGSELAALGMPGVHKVVWLKAQLFVATDGAGEIHVIREQQDGIWAEVEAIAPRVSKVNHNQKQRGQKYIGTIPVTGQYDDLTALSTNTIAWREGGQIVSLNLASKTIAVLFEPRGQRLKQFAYAAKTSQILVTCSENGQNSLWRLTPGREALEDTNFVTAANVDVNTWLDESDGYAYFNEEKQLLVRANGSSEPVKVLEHGRVSSFACTPDGKRLIIIGTSSNEPASGIWEYDITADKVRCLAPAAQEGFQDLVAGIEPEHRLVQVQGGHWWTLYIYKPIPFNRHRSYPLVVANTPLAGAQPYIAQYALAVQNAGGYFAILDRRDWSDGSGTQDAWAANEEVVVNALELDPTVDRSRIFLISNCVESRWLGIFAAKYRGCCKGMFMLIANELPEAASLTTGKYPPEIFDSACDVWEGGGDRLKKYRETAAQYGVRMDYVIAPDTMHDFVSQQSQRSRIRSLLHFVFDS